MSKQSILLTGFSGTGKSVVGRAVALSLGWEYIDTDSEIEGFSGKSIATIFEEYGEGKFRELERQQVQQACLRSRCVISVGGGAMLDDETYNTAMKQTMVICLEAYPETIHKRLAAALLTRPLLQDPDPLGRIRTLKAQRQPRYALADATIHTDGLNVESVGAEVLRVWRMLQEGNTTHSMHAKADSLHSNQVCMIHTSSRSYPVYVGWGIWNEIPDLIRRLELGRTIYLITDDQVMRLQARALHLWLNEAGFVVHTFVLPNGEMNKSLKNVQLVYEWLAELRAQRDHLVLAVGGGVIGDLAGYVAATFLRGMDVLQVPSSLVAMVDASVGGKVAVNLPQAKNLVGAFHQPQAVIADVALLETLPQRELASGWAEAVKHALILDSDLFQRFEYQAEELLSLEREITTSVVARSVTIKCGIVTEDEKELTSRRSILNYGHTVGHAIEAATSYGSYLHGEAVSIGMMAAGMLGVHLGITPPIVLDRQRKVLASLGLPLSCPGVDPDAVLRAISSDKKIRHGELRWILLDDIGHTVQHAGISSDLVRDVVGQLCQEGI